MTGGPLSDRSQAMLRVATLGGLLLVVALLAFFLRRAGHNEGDDFALYLRQARSLFDGDPDAVVADNRFAVLNSGGAFSPNAYPWGWPLLLSPFVWLWDLDYDRMKLVVIAAMCVWLLLLHGIVRRRLGRVVATGVVAVLGTSLAFLEHTDQLLSEFAHMAMVATVIWWHDRIRSRSSLITAPISELVVLGLLIVAAFNIRRESLLLVGVVVALQLVDVWREARRPTWTARLDRLRDSADALLASVGTFVVGAVLAQLLLPTALLPDNGNSIGFVDDRLRDAPRIIADQLGLGDRPAVGGLVLLLAAAGVVVGLRRRLLLDAPLLLVALATVFAIGTHPRRIDRYWLQVTPWVVVFAAGALLAAGTFIAGRLRASPGRRSAVKLATVAAPLLVLSVAHLPGVTDRIGEVRDANAATVQGGPAHPLAVEMFDAVADSTPPDAVVAFYRARTMTLLTDRRSFQTTDASQIGRAADYWVERRNRGFWQPRLKPEVIRDLGFTEVWSNRRYVLWRTGR